MMQPIKSVSAGNYYQLFLDSCNRHFVMDVSFCFAYIMKSLSLILLTGLMLASLAKAQTADFFVASDGKDSWSGTLPAPNSSANDGPFRTVTRAQTAVRAALQNSGTRTAPIVVMLRQGTYFQTAPLSFNSTDSGSSLLPVVWQNYPGETPTISGGIAIKNMTLVSGNHWAATLPQNTVYFEQLFYQNQRRFRPRLGASGGNNIGTYFRVANTVFMQGAAPPANSPDPNCTWYVAGTGWECFDRFQYDPNDPISTTWKNLAPPAGNPCRSAAGNASIVGDIEVIPFEYFTAPRLRISCIDPANNMIYTIGPTMLPVNQPKANFGFMTGHRYIIENVKDEFNQPGQWFLDRAQTPWVLNYLANSGETPDTDRIIVPQSPKLLVANGLKYVTFSGIIFEHDNFVPSAVGYPDMQQAPGISTALSFQNSSHVTLDSVVITQTSGGAVEFISCVDKSSSDWCTATSTSAVTSSNTIQNSALYDLGAMGVRIGALSQSTDTDTNMPQGTTVKNTAIEGYGRAYPSSFAIVQGDAHDSTFTHNDIYDGYQAGISICSQGCQAGDANSRGAYNNVVSFNHIHNLMQGVTDDGGGIYFNTSAEATSPTGNKVLNNKIHDITDASTQDADGYGGMGIYLDKDTGNVDVENNLVYRVTHMALQQTCGPQSAGQSNTYKNNILAFGRRGIILQGCQAPSSSVKQFDFTGNIVMYGYKSEIQQGCSSCFGGKCTNIQNYAHNLYCYGSAGSCDTTSYAFFTTDAACASSTHMSFSQWQGLGQDAGSVVADPLFVDPYYPADNFSLKSSVNASKIGFVPFNLNSPGRTSGAMEVPDITGTFQGAPKILATQTTVVSSLRPSNYNDGVTFTANVIGGYGPPPDGDEVTFQDGATVLAVVPMKGGVATYHTSSLSAGNHKVTANYGGGPLLTASTSQTLSQYVYSITSTTTLASTPNPGKSGNTVQFTANVTSAAGAPNGTVNIVYQSTVLGSGTLHNGVASVSVTLASGTKQIHATYTGNGNIKASSSANIKQVVQ